MAWQLAIKRRAVKDLEDLPANEREAVEAAIGRLVTDIGSADIKKLGGRRGEWRLRVGHWRVIFTLNTLAGEIVITHALPRKEAYQD